MKSVLQHAEGISPRSSRSLQDIPMSLLILILLWTIEGHEGSKKYTPYQQRMGFVRQATGYHTMYKETDGLLFYYKEPPGDELFWAGL